MKKKLFGKILVIGLIILFAGASVLPSISAIYKTGHVTKREYQGNQVHIEAQLPVSFYEKIKKEL